ncbi:MAG TPA: NBR1-Ig-like domain-containing protein [Anaerolineales bacterium]|nr:NBR1-Ig-like domain-containing protein [Anaerolineales bacterium]
MSPSTKKFLLFTTAMIVLLSACAPAQPTQSPDDTANQVATSVALTVAAQNAQTQAAQSAVPEATNTTLPTQTEAGPASPTPVLPTSTVIPTATAMRPPTSVSGGGGGGTTTQREYACDTIRRRPLDNTVFRPGAKFDIKWTIVNTGTKTMVAGLDLKYNSGTQMTSRTRVELPELKPGGQFAVDFDAVAPEKEGTHIMTFLVEGALCYPYVAIVVEK